MNREAALDQAVNNPALLCVSGSRLYGSNRADSDNDFRGFVLPPYEYLLGIATFEMTEVPGADHLVFGLKRYLELVLKGDPQLTDTLFTPDDKIVQVTEVGKRILGLRDLIVTNAIYRRITGYGYSEWRKARGEQLQVDDFSKTEDEVINDIRNVFAPEKADMDEIIDLLRKKKPRKVVSSKKDLGKKRKMEFEKYGFGVTSAAHAIRLHQQCAELMLTGKMTFPRPNGEYLRDLRQGKYTLEQATEVFEQACAEAHAAREKSVLPEKPQAGKVWDEYAAIVKEFVKSDPRFNA
jgi:hypothetical protein